MAEADVSARMAELETLLGLAISFEEPARPPSPKLDAVSQESTTVQAEHTPPAVVGLAVADMDMMQFDKKIIEEQRAAYREKASELEERRKKVFDCSSLRVGEPLNKDATFSPWKLVLSYPSCFIGKTNRPRAKPLFDDILNERTWDFFYLYNPHNISKAPNLLVPTEQFEFFLDEINLILDTALVIPPGENAKQFYMTFGQGGTPQPRYLKRTTDEKGLEIETWPRFKFEDIEALDKASVHMQDDWNVQMKRIQKGIPNNVKGKPDKVVRRQRAREKMLHDTQMYLGIKGDSTFRDVVFICVDVEALEFSPQCISEIGFAILDTAKVKSLAPTASSFKWFKHIQSYHLRIKEYAGHRNQKFVQGCPDSFDFGKSTFPSISEVSEEIRSIFDAYTKDERSIVLVGHDLAQDIRYLSKLGVDMCEFKNLVGEVDTKDIFQAWKNDSNGRGLHYVLSVLNVPSKNLHNAGNDAYYTLCAAVLVAREAHREEQERMKPQGEP